MGKNSPNGLQILDLLLREQSSVDHGGREMFS